MFLARSRAGLLADLRRAPPEAGVGWILRGRAFRRGRRLVPTLEGRPSFAPDPRFYEFLIEPLDLPQIAPAPQRAVLDNPRCQDHTEATDFADAIEAVVVQNQCRSHFQAP